MTENVLLIDDHLVLQILLGREPPDLRPRGAMLATTGLWYHRLCRAIANPSVVGSLSRQLGNVDEAMARAAAHAVVELPEAIKLRSLRSIGWPMAKLLADGERLNLLSLEALAAAIELQAEICLSVADDNAPLRDAASRNQIPVRTLSALS